MNTWFAIKCLAQTWLSCGTENTRIELVTPGLTDRNHRQMVHPPKLVKMGIEPMTRRLTNRHSAS